VKLADNAATLTRV